MTDETILVTHYYLSELLDHFSGRAYFSGHVQTGRHKHNVLNTAFLYRGGSSRSGRSRWRGHHGDQLTLVAACRDVLRVVSAQEGSDYEEDLEPVIKEADDLSQPLGEVWTDGLPAYRGMEHDHRYVVHDDGYVSEDGVHTNQAECFWSLLQPWLAT